MARRSDSPGVDYRNCKLLRPQPGSFGGHSAIESHVFQKFRVRVKYPFVFSRIIGMGGKLILRPKPFFLAGRKRPPGAALDERQPELVRKRTHFFRCHARFIAIDARRKGRHLEREK